MTDNEPLTLTFLGGLGEIGNNCMYFSDEDSILIVDAGLMFPELRMLGIDIAVPDFSDLISKADRIAGLVITHGHEDHIGALSHLVPHLNCPIYGSEIAIEFAKKRVASRHLTGDTEFRVVQDYEVVEIGPYSVEFIPVAHSVPGGHSLAVTTAAGLVLHSGDFKLDPSPYDGRFSDVERWRQLALDPGIRLLLIDATNADELGWTESERAVVPALSQAMSEARERRVIATCFASHLHRVAQIADVARIHGRKVLPIGRSLETSVGIASKLGTIDIEDVLITRSQAEDLDPGELCIICTGSQGEPRSALARMGEGSHREVTLSADDVVIMSSDAVPGNEADVSTMINGLVRRGARVVHAGLAKVHVSGHASADELHHTLQVLHPEAVIPIHGEYRHLAAVKDLAADAIGAEVDVLVCEDGDVVDLNDAPLRIVAEISAEPRYVSGRSVGGSVEEETIRDRQTLLGSGILSVVLSITSEGAQSLSVLSLQHFGWVSEGYWANLEPEIREFLIDELQIEAGAGPEFIEDEVIRQLGRMLTQRHGSKPFLHVRVMTLDSDTPV